jgi:y4mF family transcriptional regulator
MLLHINLYIRFQVQKFISMQNIADFVTQKRKQLGLTQISFAKKAGVALTVIRKIEQGKQDLQLSKVNQVLQMFGHTLTPVSLKLTKDYEASNNKLK